MSNENDVSQRKIPADFDPASKMDEHNTQTNETECDTVERDKASYDHKNVEKAAQEKDRRDLILTHKEAQAGGPDNIAACGEEDIGASLEFLVTKDDHHK